MKNAVAAPNALDQQKWDGSSNQPLSRYPGSKATSGAFRHIINLIPPHACYIETHLGAGAILKNKRPARINIGIDADLGVIRSWENQYHDENVELIQGDACRFLRNYSFQGNEFVFADPPYLASTRKSQRRIYRHDYSTEQHLELLEVLKSLPCFVLIAGYWSKLYTRELKGWNTYSYEVRTQVGAAKEWLWFNYQKPQILHDYRHLGTGFRERERIRRKAARWTQRVLQLAEPEKTALLSAMAELASPFPVTPTENQLQLPLGEITSEPFGKKMPKWKTCLPVS